MLRRALFFSLLGFALGWSTLAFGQYAPGLAKEEIAQLDARAGELWKSAYGAVTAGKIAEGIDFGEQLLVVQQRLFGPAHEVPLGGHAWLALQYETIDDLPHARKHREAELSIAQGIFPADSYRLTDARVHLQNLGTLEKRKPEQRKELQEAVRSAAEAFTLQQAAKLDEAQPLAEKVVEIRTRLLGETHSLLVPAWNNLASVREARAEYEAAEGLYQKGLAVSRAVFGERHPSTIIAYNNCAGVRYNRGDFAGSLTLFRDALKLAESTLGTEHPTTLVCFNNVGNTLLGLGDYIAAEPLLKQSLATRERLLGPEHPDTAVSRNNLAVLYDKLGEFPKAEALYQKALEIDRKTYGDEHPTTARTISNLGALYESMGDFVKAERLYWEALAIRKSTLPAEHPDIATTLNNLGELERSWGATSTAETMLKQALEIRMKALGPTHPDTANSLHNLAALYDSLHQYDKALRLHELTLQICRDALGSEHPRTIASQGNFAMHYFLTAEYDKCLPLLREVVEKSQRVLGATHRDTLTALGNLAAISYYAGSFGEAERLMTENLDATRQALGRTHPQTSIALSNLGILHFQRGEFVQAEPYLREALENDRRLLDLSQQVQSEQEQLRMAALQRTDLDLYLTLTKHLPLPAANAYDQVLAWKGSVLASQANQRLATSRPELGPLVAQMQETSSRLAALVFAQPEATKRAAWEKQVEEVTAERERQEKVLASQSAEFRTEQATRRVTGRELREAIPEGFALVDFVEFKELQRDAEAKKLGGDRVRSLVAFVVRRDREVVQIPLGPSERIDELIARWRKSFGRGVEAQAAGRELRAALWEPLQEALAGTTATLLSPDGALAQIPFAALPGQEPGHYLIEERPLVVVPAPQRLPGMLAEPRTGAGENPSLLLVGNVDYGKGQTVPVPTPIATLVAPSPPHDSFSPLPGTGEETAAVRDLFTHAFPTGKAELLSGSVPTKEQFKKEAGQFEYLLLATHGVFYGGQTFGLNVERSASPTLRPPVDPLGTLPGFHSALIMAGANAGNGYLFALEVATLDLRRVSLAVLSACESGLGVAEAGEGVLGLQRAFQVAGARSTVTSLWKVDDDATRALMTELHRNLWERKMPKLEAFRAAQLKMLNSSPGKGRRPRGLAPVEEDEVPDAGVSPYYWAAFQLAGDWR